MPDVNIEKGTKLIQSLCPFYNMIALTCSHGPSEIFRPQQQGTSMQQL